MDTSAVSSSNDGGSATGRARLQGLVLAFLGQCFNARVVSTRPRGRVCSWITFHREEEQCHNTTMLATRHWVMTLAVDVDIIESLKMHLVALVHPECVIFVVFVNAHVETDKITQFVANMGWIWICTNLRCGVAHMLAVDAH